MASAEAGCGAGDVAPPPAPAASAPPRVPSGPKSAGAAEGKADDPGSKVEPVAPSKKPRRKKVSYVLRWLHVGLQ